MSESETPGCPHLHEIGELRARAAEMAKQMEALFVRVERQAQMMDRQGARLATLDEVTAERDRLRAALTSVLGEFDQDKNEYTGAALDLWTGCLTSDEMTTAREALEVARG